MTWQRIDDNTYIDDTLVTCAEYQLFIDEMREQGKYYQPDHWTSHQFPKGHSHEPVLGVRQVDAVEFCSWLINRENNKWRFRLPSQSEIDVFPLLLNWKHPIGCWLKGKYQFAWIGNIQMDASGLDFEIHQILEYALPFDREFAQIVKDAFSRDLNRSFPRELETALINALDRNLNRDLALVDNDDRRRALVRTYAILDEIKESIHSIQARIAGRSPAFEGIRLVKERIK